MSGTVTKGSVERGLLAAWEALGSAVDSFSDDEMEVVGVIDDWTVKDVLGHIAFWAQQAAKNLELVAAGKSEEMDVPADEKTVDEWNERERGLRKGRPLAEVREEWLESFQAAMEALAAFPAERLEEEVKGFSVLARFGGDTYEHYREHMAQLNAWRRQLETSET